MSFYFNAAICLRTFKYRTHYGILIKWLMQHKSIAKHEAWYTCITVRVCPPGFYCFFCILKHMLYTPPVKL